jgi:hypothetical protein
MKQRHWGSKPIVKESKNCYIYGKMVETGYNECSKRTFKIRRRSTHGASKGNAQSHDLLCKHIEKRDQDQTRREMEWRPGIRIYYFMMIRF